MTKERVTQMMELMAMDQDYVSRELLLGKYLDDIAYCHQIKRTVRCGVVMRYDVMRAQVRDYFMINRHDSQFCYILNKAKHKPKETSKKERERREKNEYFK